MEVEKEYFPHQRAITKSNVTRRFEYKNVRNISFTENKEKGEQKSVTYDVVCA